MLQNISTLSAGIFQHGGAHALQMPTIKCHPQKNILYKQKQCTEKRKVTVPCKTEQPKQVLSCKLMKITVVGDPFGQAETGRFEIARTKPTLFGMEKSCTSSS